ncbi:tRNA-(ms[2]io[6]A)-hydroxylase [Psychrobacter sp. Ps5]|uniref:tRNA-(Ms[2]io[6]A)-hydroxylase n=1 Tax=Psychrobacter faecalis TaxID=180588 RepID=A0ABT9HEK7_9GAMM|nr:MULTISPECIES: tRNA-(ms[2]io[6]A)-hydroxylase [Psychrobacter]MCG3860186.1 tRNA-(ms[2]io[6]A)-hydroxylase [Psychrobacter sp. Ps5]MDP4544203.1 tRNA-(ms[2]io[6]A)-hydroxylase [Psychrobacter faecalis]
MTINTHDLATLTQNNDADEDISQEETSQEDSVDIAQLRTPLKVDLSPIYEFLGARTTQAWVDAALADLPLIIQDHANCEKKAAGTAMNLIFRYEFSYDLQRKLAQLIREEMLHYEQVLGIMNERGQAWKYLSAGRYAKGMLKHKRTYEPAAMVDVLIIGAFIEARSCERFAALAEVINDKRLAKYYRYLLKSESRHFEDYLALAQSLAEDNIDERVAFFREVEAELISSPDAELRFHSGNPA